MFHLILRPACALLISAVMLPYAVSAAEPNARRARGVDRAEVQTKVIQLEHADCELLANHIRALFHEPDGRKKVTGYRPKNVILVRALPSEIEQMEQIVSLLDVATPKKKFGHAADRAKRPQPVVKIIRLQYADAEAIADVLRPLLMTGGRRRGGSSGVRTEIVVDERTNALVIQGVNKQIQLAVELIQELDIPVGGSNAADKD